MTRHVLMPAVAVLALLVFGIASLSPRQAALAEPVPTPGSGMPGITPTAASGGLLNATPYVGSASAGLLSATPTPIPTTPVTNPISALRVPSGPARQPTQTPVPQVCALSGPEYRQDGDQRIVIGQVSGGAGAPTVSDAGAFMFDLPPGDYMVARILRNNVTTVQVCYAADGSVLTLARNGGAELSRSVRSPDAGGAFDAIVASIRPPDLTGHCLADCPPPKQAPSGPGGAPVAVAVPGGGAPTVRPTNTGDAGLVACD